MNVEALHRALRTEGILESAYCLEGGLPCEEYVLAQETSGWAVYYGERGDKTGYRHFDGESDACDYFFATITHDKTTYRKASQTSTAEPSSENFATPELPAFPGT
jgi:hypothetical protein